ncbi:type II toxin-antitoxin system ParD family antitoxin [Reyranella sp.]|uniref:type II toxin-antitoxin system ParD family antitoxin n=1 Tax=Reyranella sp. TaxID=1929291 RepID=UPI00345D754F
MLNISWPHHSRLLEEHESWTIVLQAALMVGEESGTPAPFDSEAKHSRYEPSLAVKDIGNSQVDDDCPAPRISNSTASRITSQSNP